MYSKNTLLYTLALLLGGTGASVGAQDRQQTIYGGRITVARPEPSRRSGDSLTIRFRLGADSLRIPSARSLTLTPILAGEADSLRLQPILLNGRNRHQVYRRDRSLGTEAADTYYTVRKMTGDAALDLAYRQTLPFEPWMEKARLVMEEDLCGCGGHTEEISRQTLFALSLPAAPAPAAAPFEPAYSYVQPAPEAVKHRTELKNIYLSFPVNQTVIHPDYRDNPASLAAARTMIEQINADKNLTIREVVIRGYASPEGPAAANNRLSAGRAAALETYLAGRLRDTAIPLRSESGGEDWEGVIEALQTAPFAGASDLLAAIRACDRSDAAEQALRTLAGGAPYRQMAQTIYPQVRRVVCSVAYTARAFTLAESREILSRHPEQLSLHELWQVADSYPENSAGFKDALLTAARLFPADETALLNAANVALADGRYDEAARYLDSIHTAGAAAENARGLLAVYRKEYTQAAAHFRRAIEAGSEAARQNLAQLNNNDANK